MQSHAFLCGGKLGNMSQEPKETLNTLTSQGDAPPGDERQDGTHQQGWPLTIFVRHSTSDLPDRVDNNQKETTEV
jgi:hypothetical protein